MSAAPLSLVDAVQTLDGLNAAEIAALLSEAGVTGWPSAPCACPIAIYLGKLTGEAVTVVYTTCWHGTGTGVRMSQGMSDFIDGFDRGLLFQELAVREGA